MLPVHLLTDFFLLTQHKDWSLLTGVELSRPVFYATLYKNCNESFTTTWNYKLWPKERTVDLSGWNVWHNTNTVQLSTLHFRLKPTTTSSPLSRFKEIISFKMFWTNLISATQRFHVAPELSGMVTCPFRASSWVWLKPIEVCLERALHHTFSCLWHSGLQCAVF